MTLDPDSPAVQTHLSIMQGVIERMAENSRSCKLWCITIVSAILVFAARVESMSAEYAVIALIPIALLGCLDAMYLNLERSFRNSYNDFVDKMHDGQLVTSEIYRVKPLNDGFFKSLFSWSVLPFYLVLVGCVLGVYLLGYLGI